MRSSPSSWATPRAGRSLRQPPRARGAGARRDALESAAKNKMLDELIGRYHFPVPESFVQQRVDARLERGLRALAQQGMKAEDMRKLDFGRLRAAQRDEAEREVRASLVVDRIADAENVTVSDEELDNERDDVVHSGARAVRVRCANGLPRTADGAAARGATAREDEQRALREAGVIDERSQRRTSRIRSVKTTTEILAFGFAQAR